LITKRRVVRMTVLRKGTKSRAIVERIMIEKNNTKKTRQYCMCEGWDVVAIPMLPMKDVCV
jgi:hypothetical protein